MSLNYREAANRHFEDGEVLQNATRYPNADQLYGLAAECSLKAVMVGLGMQVTNKGAPQDRAHKVHMPELWLAFQSFAEGRLASRYLEPLSNLNPFGDWTVDQRYWLTNSISAARTNNHRNAAALCRQSMALAVLDGVCR